MESKIKSVSAHIYKEEHETFTNKYNKKNWKFDIEFEDGNKGIAFGISTNFKYHVGDLVSFTMNENDYGKTFLGLKLVESPGATTGAFKSTYNDPTTVKKMSRSEAWELAITFIKNKTVLDAKLFTYVDIKQTKETFEEYIVRDGIDRDKCSRRYFAIRHAIELMDIEDCKIKTRNDVFKYADAEMEDLTKLDQEVKDSNDLI